MAPKMPHRKYAYFRDDQILFLVTHEADGISREKLDTFQTNMNDRFKVLKRWRGREIVASQVFSFPGMAVEDREQRVGRVAVLRDLETKARDEDLKKRLDEVQKLKGLLNDKEGKRDSTELRSIKKEWKKDEDWQNLQSEVQRRESLLSKRQASAGDQPKHIDSPFSVLLCDLNKESQRNDADSSSLLENIGDLRGSLRERSLEVLPVEIVSPNWLMSVSSQGGATGGPGALPMPFDPEEYPGPPPYSFHEFIEVLTKRGLYSDGENVDVAILDTAPRTHDLVLAVKEWPNHPLIKNLLGPSGKLKVYHATDKAIWRMTSTSINKHDYPMPYHGLFAAGIVHSIVPKSSIHLIEVLNEFGVGDLASLAEGLALAFDQIYKPSRRLVVNCSWMLELPLSDLHCSASDKDSVEYDFEQGIRRYVEEEDTEHALALRAICNKLAEVGGVVAAAGNDKLYAKERRAKKIEKLKKEGIKKENSHRWIDYLLEDLRQATPEARYPAAFASVVGVGALPPGPKLDLNVQKYVSSEYSNFGDKPVGDAILTLGGEEGEDDQGKNKGILGLYLRERFPKVESDPDPEQEHKRKIVMYDVQEPNGWAWWAGTSFAAPILTGAIAAVFGTGIRRTEDAVNALKINQQQPPIILPIIEDAGTNDQEDVMYVKQGPPPP